MSIIIDEALTPSDAGNTRRRYKRRDVSSSFSGFIVDIVTMMNSGQHRPTSKGAK
jgi:hypothetical protein